VDIRERNVAVRGLSLRVRERGPQDASAAVLLHGWLDHRGSFDLLAPLLPGRTLAYDHRGHGDSSWAGAGAFYHFVDYLGDLEGLFRRSTCQGRCVSSGIRWAARSRCSMRRRGPSASRT